MSFDVHVVVLTRNHASHIRGCIESILAQQTTYSYRILVFDDGSEDGTDLIVRSLQSASPDKIEFYRSDSNRGIEHTVKSAVDAVNARYIALLDGDDVWTYNGKLQAQVSYLDANTEYNGCFHDADIVHLDDADRILFQESSKYSHNYLYKLEIGPADLIKRLIIPSGALVIRASAMAGLPEQNVLSDRYSVLWKITCHVIRNSKFRFFRETWSEYRNHRQGISKSNNLAFHISHITYLRSLLEDEYYRGYRLDIYESLSDQYKSLLYKIRESHARGLTIHYARFLGVEIKRLWFLYVNLRG
jgi:glycosyltransferase involved in cell wall biosynthesis